MLCDRCHQNEATIHIEKIHDGKREKINLCAECAKKEAPDGALNALGFNLADMLFKGFGKKGQSQHDHAHERAPEPDIVCPQCFWDYSKFKASGGQLGCPECYRSFSPLIDEVLKNVQRGPVHVGKRPGRNLAGRTTLAFELEKAEQELKGLVRREEYEKAAVCRDRIAELKQKLQALDSAEGDEEA